MIGRTGQRPTGVPERALGVQFVLYNSFASLYDEGSDNVNGLHIQLNRRF